jgi:hypothetical protein
VVSPDTPGSSCTANAIPLIIPDGGVASVSGVPIGFPIQYSCELDVRPGISYRTLTDLPATLRFWVAGSDSPALAALQACPADPLSTMCSVARSSGQLLPDTSFAPVVLVDGSSVFTLFARRSPATTAICSTAIELSLDDGGVAVRSGDLSQLYDLAHTDPQTLAWVDDGTGGIFHVVLLQPADVKFSATAGGQPASLCVWGATCVRPVSCQNTFGATDLRNLPAGDLYFSVTTTGNAVPPVPYDLRVTTSPLIPGDRCFNPIDLQLVSDGGLLTASYLGTTAGADLELFASCVSPPGFGGPDLLFDFTTTDLRTLEARVTTTDATFRPGVAFRGADCSGPDVRCDLAAVSGAGAVVSASLLPAGHYYLWVSSLGTGPNSPGGPFSLELTLSP